MQYPITKREIKALIESQYPDHNFAWQERGGRLWGFCPEHRDKKTPNLNIFSPDGKKWLWHCFACGFSGPKNTTPEGQDISVLKKYLKEKLNGFDNTFLNYLQDRIPGLGEDIDLNILSTLDIGAYSREIANKITSDTIKEKMQEYKLDKHEWLVFIYRDVNLNPVSIKFRNISIPKFDPEWKKIGTRTIKLNDNAGGFFNAQDIHSPLPFLIAVEGEFDALTTHIVTQGRYPVIAVSGTSGFTPNMAKTIIKTDSEKAYFLLPDWDEAGIISLKRLVDNLSEKFLQNRKIYSFNAPSIDNVKDMDEYLKGKYDYADDAMADIFENTFSLKSLKEKLKSEKNEEKRKVLNTYPDSILTHIGISDGANDIVIINAKESFKKNIHIDETDVMGIKVQYGAIWGLVGTTSMGKTELAMDILNKHAKLNGRSLLIELEGTQDEIIYRIQKKGINSERFDCVLKPNFELIDNYLQNHKSEKILVVIDYLQAYARRLLGKSKNKNENLRNYVNYIYEYMDDLRKKNTNVSFCFIMSLSKEGIKESIGTDTNSIRINLLNGIKESGDVQYDLDYVYAVTFLENEQSEHIYLSRFADPQHPRNVLKLLAIKSQRVGLNTNDVFLRYSKNTAGGGNYYEINSP